MGKLIECVPNFSEGRDLEKVDQIAGAVTAVEGVRLVNQQSDPDHNRSVLTLVGAPEAVVEAAFQACRAAAELIDMDQHEGVHPRIGATDVIPLVPLKEVSEEEAIAVARELGERIGKELKIPVYLYEKAASTAAREDLAEVRRGEYEGLKEAVRDEQVHGEQFQDGRPDLGSDFKPDFGPAAVGKAGATAVGVRDILVAFNVNLDSQDVKVARQIAREIRTKDGGFPYLKALGFDLRQQGLTQVSMNIIDYRQVSLRELFEAIQDKAKKAGAKVVESELIGLAPEEFLLAVGPDYQEFLKLKRFKEEQILERWV